MTNFTVLDQRVAESTPLAPLNERVPLGSFVAYNGPSDDGERKRAIVIGHGDDGELLELLDGPDKIVLDDAEQLATVVVLATSADRYAQRVSTKSRALGRKHGWCEVAENAITELNQTPENGTFEAMEPINVRVTITRDLVLRPRRTHYNGSTVTPENMLDQLQRKFYHSAEFNYDSFQQLDGTQDMQVTIEVVDEFTPTADEAPAAVEEPAKTKKRH